MQASVIPFLTEESGSGVRESLVPAPGLRSRLRALVVVPTLNEEAQIERVLVSLLEGLPRDVDVRVAVVDGGSHDRTVAIVSELAQRYPELTLLHNPARIQSAAINLAMRTLGRDVDVLIRCDAHAQYPTNFCQRLLQTLHAKDADSVVVPLDSTGTGALQLAVAWVSNTPVGSGGSAHRGGRHSGFVDHGHHAAFRAEMFRACGGYDETFTHNEDAELDCRQRAHGARIYLDSEIRVGYHPRSTWRGLWRQYFCYGYGRSRTIGRHPGSLRLRQLAVPLNLLLVCLSLAFSAWRPILLAWPAFYLSVLAVTGLYGARRLRSWAGLLAGPAAGVMHTAWAIGFLTGAFHKPERAWRIHHTKPLCEDEPSPEGRETALSRRLHATLVDPSLFTAPYDAALTSGLLSSGVHPTWTVRPVRPGDREEIAAELAEPLFYRHVDRVAWLPGPLRAAAKSAAHVIGLGKLVWRTLLRKPDVVHFQWLVLPVFDVLAIAIIRRICPVVVTVHDTVAFNGDRLSSLRVLGFDRALRLAHRLIVHTQAGRDTLVRRGLAPEKVCVIPHGPLALPVAPRGDQSRDPRWTFLLFGEMKRYKGIDVLVEAVALLPATTRERARFVIAGRPQMDLAPVRARIAELGLESCIELLPKRLSEQEMADLFAVTDCFLFPYRQVDASGVYFLVKSTGKWLIATRVGVFAEDLEEGTQGTLIDSEDPRALASAMKDAILDRPIALTTSADSSWDAIGRRTRETYVEARATAGLEL